MTKREAWERLRLLDSDLEEKDTLLMSAHGPTHHALKVVLAIERKRREPKLCRVKGCRRPLVCQETALCLPHHLRLRRHGDVFADVPIGKKGKLK